MITMDTVWSRTEAYKEVVGYAVVENWADTGRCRECDAEGDLLTIELLGEEGVYRGSFEWCPDCVLSYLQDNCVEEA